MTTNASHCDFGGYCKRAAGHRGAHMPSTDQWSGYDVTQTKAAHGRAVLAYLDFLAPDVGPFEDE